MNKQELLSLLNKYEQAYYSGESIISDEEYDALKDKYTSQYGEYDFVPGEGDNTGFKKVNHIYPLLSLDKIQLSDKAKLRKELERLWPVIIQPKFDGISVGIQKNLFVTRGDGYVGDDVTAQCLQIPDIDLITDLFDNDSYYFESLRAEILMTHGWLRKLNAEREKKDLPLYENCRNAAAGMVKNKDLSKVKGLCIMIYEELGSTCNESDDIYNIEELIGEDALEYAEDTIRITPTYKPVDIDAAIDFLEHLEDYRKTIDYDIDGWVVKSDIDNSLEHHGGMTGHHPKNAFAVKGKAKGGWTRLKSITWQVGKENITPVAELEPIRIEGSTISRCTLHNVSIMEALGIEKITSNTMVRVVKANDVIPRITEVKYAEEESKTIKTFNNCDVIATLNGKELGPLKLTSMNYSNRIAIPLVCPVCGGFTEFKDTNSESKILICTNPECKAKLHSRIEQMASRDGFNIVGLSEGTITKILDTYDVEHSCEILDMTKDEILKLEGFAEKSADNLYKALQKTMSKQPLNRILYAASIHLIGRDASKRICETYNLKELYTIFDKSDEEVIKDLTAIKNIGTEIAASLVKHKLLFMDLVNYIEIVEDIKKNQTSKEQLAFCITGQREPFKSMIEETGHKVTGSVSKKTKALIDSSMDMSTTKAIKAQELGIPIISTVDELKKYL